MLARRKIMVVLGTRPEAIKLAPVILDLRRRDGLEVVVCASGQHRELLDHSLAAFGIVPDIDLDVMRPDQSLEDLTARLLTGIGAAIDRVRPDRLVVQGDTATAFAAALAAHYRRQPVAHVEAGLRSGDPLHPWPEEAHRRMVTALADLHFAPTVEASAALAREHVDPVTVHVTGNSVIDALLDMRARIRADPALAAGLDEVVARFAGRRLIAVTMHRRENRGEGMARIARALARIAARSDVAILFPLHPSGAVTGAMRPVLEGLANVALLPPLDYPHFVRLLMLAHLVLTDSGGVQEEAPAIGLPVLVLRERTERPEGVVAGTARLVGTDETRIVSEVAGLLDDPLIHAAMARAHNPYGDGRAARRIGAILAQN